MPLIIFFGAILYAIAAGIYTVSGLIIYSGEKIAAKRENREIGTQYANIPRHIAVLFLIGLILTGLIIGLVCYAVNGM